MRNAINFTSKALHNRLAVLFVALLLSSSNAFSQSKQAQQWWFTVELIAFERDISPSNSENFEYADFEFSDSNIVDIYSLALTANSFAQNRYLYALPKCNQHQPNINGILATPNIELSLFNDSNSQLDFSYFNAVSQSINLSDYQITCVSEYQLNQLSALRGSLKEIPKEIFATGDDYSAGSHLVSKSQLSLADYAKTVYRQRDIRPLLYTAWRQQVVFGKDKASFYKIRAGELLDANAVNSTMSPIALSEQATLATEQTHKNDFFDQLKERLNNPNKVDWLALEHAANDSNEELEYQTKKWSLDGLLKVYLEYVNQVPYLHLESEFKQHRIKMDADGLAQISTYPFKQRRRIISKQIHYFDHPAFGLIVRLERFEPPAPKLNLDE